MRDTALELPTGDWTGQKGVAALVLAAVWVAFGPGSRECSVSLAQFGSVATDWLCRGMFGSGALVGAALPPGSCGGRFGRKMRPDPLHRADKLQQVAPAGACRSCRTLDPMNDDDFVDPSPKRKLRLGIHLAVIAICCLPFITWRPMEAHLRTVSICEGLPWLRAYAISALVVFAFFIAATAWYGYQTVRSAQSPLPSAIVFRRTKVVRGFRVVLQGYVVCGLAFILLASLLFVIFGGWPLFRPMFVLGPCGGAWPLHRAVAH